jgi:hypothetical protein
MPVARAFRDMSASFSRKSRHCVPRFARSTKLRAMRSPVSTAKKTAANVRELIAGVSYSRSLPSASGTNVVQPVPRGKIEEYFDEHTEGPGLWKWRHYFPIYERHFARFRGQSVHIVEVGIFSGGSLPMWLKYFGVGAHIYGVDIEDACRVYAGPQIDVFIGDQADPTFWRRLLTEIPQIDVLIDDGGHEAHQQVATLKATLPAMSPGGVYLCEDSHGAAHPFHAFIDGLGHGLHDVFRGNPSPLQQHISSIHRYPLVTVIEKPTLPVARFEAPKHGTQWQPFYE